MPCGFSQDFLLFFDSLQFNIICQGVDKYLVVTDLPGSMVWCLSLILENYHSLSLKIFLLFFLFSWYLHYSILHLLEPSHSSWTFHFIFFSLFSFSHLRFSSYYWTYLQAHSFFPVCNLLMSPSKACFISVRVIFFYF